MFYIQPDECVNCCICVSVCPVEAIYADDRLPAAFGGYLAINREFFDDAVTGWGMPGGLSDTFRSDLDHPFVRDRPPRTA
jgi:ferredoxin